MGDLVRKLGERVLPEIIPILEKGLESSQPDQRQGVCIGLSEIMASTSRDMVLTFVNSLVPTVRKALCDPLPEVRQAAAKTFDSLHSTVGVRALDDILPAMLHQLVNTSTDYKIQKYFNFLINFILFLEFFRFGVGRIYVGWTQTSYGYKISSCVALFGSTIDCATRQHKSFIHISFRCG